MAQRAGGQPFVELVQHGLGHVVRGCQRLRSDFDPHQFNKLGVRMDDVGHAVGDGRCFGREEPRIETPHTARRCDGAGDQEQAGRIGQRP